MMKDAVLFDLGNTLVRYFSRSEFPAILEQAIRQVRDYLAEQGLRTVWPEGMWRRVAAENHEAEDHRVRPLEGRLARIFQLDADQRVGVGEGVCRAFLQPIFARGCSYEDTLPALQGLRDRGARIAIVSNAPWGSPAQLWHEETRRLGLSQRVDAVVFCTEVGWRKPAAPIFHSTMRRLGVGPQDCVFVGDDPRWDLVGPRAVGIDAILLDRDGIAPSGHDTIHSLNELVAGDARENGRLWASTVGIG